jgi:hypothetical protein
MIDKAKLSKFIKRLDGLVVNIERRREPAIQQKINQSYYKRRGEELKVLLTQYEETEKRLEKMASVINEDYSNTLQQWRNDMRWLSNFQRSQQSKAVL